MIIRTISWLKKSNKYIICFNAYEFQISLIGGQTEGCQIRYVLLHEDEKLFRNSKTVILIRKVSTIIQLKKAYNCTFDVAMYKLQ